MNGLRGLDLRLEYARLQVWASIDGLDALQDTRNDLWSDLVYLGMCDFHRVQIDPPPLFADVPWMCRAWLDGFNYASLGDEMRGCDGCQNEDGAPCPVHG